MPIVLNPNQPLIAIDIYYVEEKKKQGHTIYHFIHSQEDMDEWLSKDYYEEGDLPAGADPAKIIQKLMTAWKKLTWGDHNIIVSNALNFSGPDSNRTIEIDPIRYRDEKLKKCLKKWNVVDENDQPVPVTAENIDQLMPEISQELISSFEKTTEIGEDDIKK